MIDAQAIGRHHRGLEGARHSLEAVARERCHGGPQGDEIIGRGGRAFDTEACVIDGNLAAGQSGQQCESLLRHRLETRRRAKGQALAIIDANARKGFAGRRDIGDGTGFVRHETAQGDEIVLAARLPAIGALGDHLRQTAERPADAELGAQPRNGPRRAVGRE
ncbi:hypothetical protein AE618_03745 [Bosea vaviloviae]|uniref:Uncharacterized protein n=1 Tax=Bosea vaviloviae TaxID=1526658 RepID=A0A0N0MCP3_9HYPH|nr:hypothetical protein AE618_03745 [Bosea vaviloviae]